jgi:hypothetical protein
VRNEVLLRGKEQRNILQVNGRPTGMVTFCVETVFYNRFEGKIKGRTEVTRRRGRRRRKVLDDLKGR